MVYRYILKKQTNKTTSVKTQFQHSFPLLHILINRYTIFFTTVWCLKLIHTHRVLRPSGEQPGLGVGGGAQGIRVRVHDADGKNDQQVFPFPPPHRAASKQVITSPDRVKTAHCCEPMLALFPSKITSKKGSEKKRTDATKGDIRRARAGLDTALWIVSLKGSKKPLGQSSQGKLLAEHLPC